MYDSGSEPASGLGIIFTILIVLLTIVFLALWIWGIYKATKTNDREIRTGRIFLHLIIWGGLAAAIIYAIKVTSNQNEDIKNRLYSYNPKIENQSSFREDSNKMQIAKIDKLLESKSITKEEHKKLKEKYTK
ncbi:hypothetical protein MYMA111404_03120 [Mycoplasma marinum]|uniref:SHOCT domain-containing protein n=1 Tax=Mycoplasma marinum TaxID=1937190 RepID=A0A4R0XQN2_9MOLU|nr:hypothetical protein [Mycoplasma marinum]TCG11185.1 hypothetical protein C4B24_02785 [Mycoplasma marinum]